MAKRKVAARRPKTVKKSMGAEEKTMVLYKKTEEGKRKQQSSHPSKSKRKGKREAAVQMIQFRSYPSHICSFFAELKGLMDEDQARVIRNSLFGQYLDLPELMLERGLIDAILGFWDPKLHGLKLGNHDIPFTVEDVAVILGLKSFGTVIRLDQSKDAGELNGLFVDSQKGITKDMIQKKMLELVEMNRKEDHQLLLKLYVLYIFCALFFSNSNNTVAAGLLGYVENPDHLNQCNWAKAVYDYFTPKLDDASARVKARNTGDDGICVGYLSGCPILLAIWFFEHTTFVAITNEAARPRVFRWKRDGYKHRTYWTALLDNTKESQVIGKLHIEDEERSLIEASPSSAKKDKVAKLKRKIRKLRKRNRVYELALDSLEKQLQGERRLREDRDQEIAKLNEKILKMSEGGVQSDKGTPCDEGNKFDAKYSATASSPPHADDTLAMAIVAGDIDHPSSPPHHEVVLITSSVSDAGPPNKERSMIKEIKHRGARMKSKHISQPYVHFPEKRLKKKDSRGDVLDYCGKDLLTQEQCRVIEHFIQAADLDLPDVVYQHCPACSVSKQQLLEVLKNQYIDGDVIDTYAHLVLDRPVSNLIHFKKILYISAYFWQWQTSKSSSAERVVKTYLAHMTKEAIAEASMIVAPLCTADHWVLAVCDLTGRRLGCYSSIANPVYYKLPREFLQWLSTYLLQVASIDTSTWAEEYGMPCPSQGATINCAIFVMKFIECLQRDAPFDFTAEDTNSLRGLMAFHILQHRVDWPA